MFCNGSSTVSSMVSNLSYTEADVNDVHQPVIFVWGSTWWHWTYAGSPSSWYKVVARDKRPCLAHISIFNLWVSFGPRTSCHTNIIQKINSFSINHTLLYVQLEVHSVEHVYFWQQCFDASKPRIAASMGPQYHQVHGVFWRLKTTHCCFDGPPIPVRA